MSNPVLPGRPPVPLVLRRSPRARRISLRVSNLDGRVTLTLPPGVPEAEAIDFAQTKEAWIRGHLEKRPQNANVTVGGAVPLEGQIRRIVAAPGRRVQISEHQIAVPEPDAAAHLKAHLRELARDRLRAASDQYAALLGRSYSRLTLRDTRSRWGSCSSQGALMYSWRLILAPPEVLRYVAAHEVAHLAEMNHSSAFWSEVEQLYGPYTEARRWLRTEGNDLHRYRFDD